MTAELQQTGQLLRGMFAHCPECGLLDHMPHEVSDADFRLITEAWAAHGCGGVLASIDPRCDWIELDENGGSICGKPATTLTSRRLQRDAFNWCSEHVAVVTELDEDWDYVVPLAPLMKDGQP